MGKSSGGGGGGATGSQTIIQDIAEPFKGFATRSLQRAEDLQGLPSIPFTGIATAPPSPDELVAAQALRNRFLEGQPLTEEALALQATAADPITAASIQARQNPFEAQIAQEAYRRLDERTQRDLQNQRARETASGGTDRGRGAIEDSLIRQRAEDQERQIGLEAGQRAFTDASRLAIADRQARADTAAGINARLGERQSMGRRDIDDLLRVGAQFREKFVQPELNLERQQFGEFRGPASVQNPFGFEQFFSGIRSAAPTPGITTTQNFAQTPSGLSQAIPAIGGAISAGNQLGVFNQGGIANFHEGGLAEHRMADHSLPEHDPGVIDQIIRVLQEQGHLVKGPNGRMEFGIRMLNDPSFKPLYKQALTGVVEGSGYLPPMLDTETVVEEARVEQRPQSRETGRSDFDAMVDTHGQLAKGFTDERQRVSGIEAAALARAEEEMRNRAISPQTLREAGQRRFDEARRDRQDWLGGERERRKTLSDPQASQWSESMGIEEEEVFDPVGEREGSGFMYRTGDAIDMVPEDRADFRERGRSKAAAIDFDEGEEFTESTSEPDMDEGSDVGMAPYVEEEAPAEYWAESMEGLPDRMAEAVEGRAISPEPERKYTDSEITAMMEFSMTGRGRERLPREMFGLDTLEVQDALKPIRERARKASAPRRAQERRDRIANRRGFRRDDGGIRDSDTPSYDITFDDVKEFFNFKDGGIASFSKGGGFDAEYWLNPMKHLKQGDPLTRAVLGDEMHGKLQELKGPFNRFEPEKEEKPAYMSIEAWQEYQRKRHAQQTAELDRGNRRANTKRQADTGLTSLNKGGIARFDNGSEVIEEVEVSRSVPPSTLYGKEREQRDQDNKDAMLGMMETEERDPDNPQDVAEFMREGFGEHASPPGYPSRTLGLRQREKYERGQRAVEDLVAKQQDNTSEPEAPNTEESAMGAQLSKFLEMYEDSFSKKLTKGYPKNIPLSDEQRKQGMIGAIAAAMMAVKSDKFGGTDFSGAGPAAAAHVASFKGGLEKTRKEEIAARAAHRAALLKGATTTAEVFKNMSAGEKDRASAALDTIKAKYPDLELYKIVTPALMKAIGEGMMSVDDLDTAVLEAVRVLKGAAGLSQDTSGSILKGVDIEGVLSQSPSR